jgi:hypothetical protein
MTKLDRRSWFSLRVIAGYAIAVGSVVVALAASLLLDIYAVTAPGIAVCLRRNV